MPITPGDAASSDSDESSKADMPLSSSAKGDKLDEQRKDSTLQEEEDAVREMYTARILAYICSPSAQTHSIEMRRAHLLSLDLPKNIIDEYLGETKETRETGETEEMSIEKCIAYVKDLLKDSELRAYSKWEKRDILRGLGISDYRIGIIVKSVWQEVYFDLVRKYLNTPSIHELPTSEQRACLLSFDIPDNVIDEFFEDEYMSDAEVSDSEDVGYVVMHDDDEEEKIYQAEFKVMVGQIREILAGPDYRDRTAKENKNHLRSQGVAEDVIEEVFEEENKDMEEAFITFGQAIQRRRDQHESRPPDEESSPQINPTNAALQRNISAAFDLLVRHVHTVLEQPKFRDWSSRKKRIFLKLWDIPSPVIVKLLGVEYESEKQEFEVVRDSEIEILRRYLDSQELTEKTTGDWWRSLMSHGFPLLIIQGVLGPRDGTESGMESPGRGPVRNFIEMMNTSERPQGNLPREYDKGSPPGPGIVDRIQFAYIAGAGEMILDDRAMDESESLVQKKGLFRRHERHGRSTYVPVTKARRDKIQFKREMVDGEMKAHKLARDIRYNVRGRSKGALRRKNAHLRINARSSPRRYAMAGGGESPVNKAPPWRSRSVRELTPALGSSEDKRMKREAQTSFGSQSSMASLNSSLSPPPPPPEDARTEVRASDSPESPKPKLTLNTIMPPPLPPNWGRWGEQSTKRERGSSLGDLSPGSPTKKVKSNEDRPPVTLKLRKVAKKLTARDVEREGSYLEDETEAEKAARFQSFGLDAETGIDPLMADALMSLGQRNDEGKPLSLWNTEDARPSTESPRSPRPDWRFSDEESESSSNSDSDEEIDYNNRLVRARSIPPFRLDVSVPSARPSQPSNPRYGQPGPSSAAIVRTEKVAFRKVPGPREPEPIIDFKIVRNRLLYYLPGSKQWNHQEKDWISALDMNDGWNDYIQIWKQEFPAR